MITRAAGYNEESVADIIENALKLLTDVKDSGDVRVIQTALRELRYAFKLFAPYAHVRKVTMFGSARTQPTRPEYQQAVEFGRKIAAGGLHGHYRRGRRASCRPGTRAPARR